MGANDTSSRMTAAEFRAIREGVGVTLDWMADHLRVNNRTPRAWEQGRAPVPDSAATAARAMYAATLAAADELAAAVRESDEPLLTFRTDADMPRLLRFEGTRWPAAWHRGVCLRASHALAGRAIDYHGEPVEVEFVFAQDRDAETDLLLVDGEHEVEVAPAEDTEPYDQALYAAGWWAINDDVVVKR